MLNAVNADFYLFKDLEERVSISPIQLNFLINNIDVTN